MSASKITTFKDPEGTSHKLTLKQTLFAEKYIETRGDSLEAVKAAGYEMKNDNVGYSIASENLSKPKIRAYISEKLRAIGLTD